MAVLNCLRVEHIRANVRLLLGDSMADHPSSLLASSSSISTCHHVHVDVARPNDDPDAIDVELDV